MSKLLPPRPNLDHLRSQAKDLLKQYRAGDPSAIARVREGIPNRALSEAPRLHDAQFVIAREYGFAGWPALKAHVEAVRSSEGDAAESFQQAFRNDDAAWFGRLLKQFPEFTARINQPVAPFDAPLITAVCSRKMLDVLLEAGADINAKSRWWAGGFGLLHTAEPDLADYAIQRGAVADVHAAARLGMMDKLHELIADDPALVHARGGDGQTPLHFASTVEVAKFLLDHGADVEARDIDHESTPAQYMVRDRQEVLRYLIQRGCRTDLFMAAALGDVDLARKHLDSDPSCIGLRVDHGHFPMINPKSGGTIYQWTLGWHVSAHDVAKEFGRDAVLQLLMERSPASVKLMFACWSGDENAAESLLASYPDLVANLSSADRRQIAHAARNNNLRAVSAMLKAGLPVDALGQHYATPLHWAAFHGNAGMIREILRYHPPLEKADADFKATPLGWAIHGSVQGWNSRTGDYATTVELLMQAGARLPEKSDGGTEAVRAVLRRFGSERG